MFKWREGQQEAIHHTNIKRAITSSFARSLKVLQQKHLQCKEEEFVYSNDGSNNLCSSLESAFLHGLKDSVAHKLTAYVGLTAAPDQTTSMNFWSVVVKFTHGNVVTQLQKLTQITTEIGLCRAWVRLALNDGLMESYLHSMIVDTKTLKYFYHSHSYLRDHEQPGILKNYLTGLMSLEFKLSYNSSVLNQWSNTTLQLTGTLDPHSTPAPTIVHARAGSSGLEVRHQKSSQGNNTNRDEPSVASRNIEIVHEVGSPLMVVADLPKTSVDRSGVIVADRPKTPVDRSVVIVADLPKTPVDRSDPSRSTSVDRSGVNVADLPKTSVDRSGVNVADLPKTSVDRSGVIVVDLPKTSVDRSDHTSYPSLSVSDAPSNSGVSCPDPVTGTSKEVKVAQLETKGHVDKVHDFQDHSRDHASLASTESFGIDKRNKCLSEDKAECDLKSHVVLVEATVVDPSGSPKRPRSRRVGDEDMQYLCSSSFPGNSSTQQLHIAHSDKSKDGAYTLSTSFQGNTHLHSYISQKLDMPQERREGLSHAAEDSPVFHSIYQDSEKSDSKAKSSNCIHEEISSIKPSDKREQKELNRQTLHEELRPNGQQRTKRESQGRQNISYSSDVVTQTAGDKISKSSKQSLDQLVEHSLTSGEHSITSEEHSITAGEHSITAECSPLAQHNSEKSCDSLCSPTTKGREPVSHVAAQGGRLYHISSNGHEGYGSAEPILTIDEKQQLSLNSVHHHSTEREFDSQAIRHDFPAIKHVQVAKTEHDSPAIKHVQVAKTARDSPALKHVQVAETERDSPAIKHVQVAETEPHSPAIKHVQVAASRARHSNESSRQDTDFEEAFEAEKEMSMSPSRFGNSLSSMSGWSSEIESKRERRKQSGTERSRGESFATMLRGYMPASSQQSQSVTLNDVIDTLPCQSDDDSLDGSQQSDEVSETQNVQSSRMYFLFHVAREHGLSHQNFACKGCSRPIGIIYGAPRLCEFDGGLYCFGCHENNETYIPSSILFDWDFRKKKVSQDNYKFLQELEEQALYNVEELSPKLYSHVPELQDLKTLRQQLVYLKSYLFACSQKVAESMRQKVWPREHLYDSRDLYSVMDFLQVQSGSLQRLLKDLVKSSSQHVYDCALCSLKGFVCEICRNPLVIYPFEVDTTVRCTTCKAVYHKTCMTESLPCPKCERWGRHASSNINDCHPEDYGMSPHA